MLRRSISRLLRIAAVPLLVIEAAPVRASQAEDEQALAAMHDLAQCLIGKHRYVAARILAYVPQDPQGVAAFYGADPGNCMGFEGQLSMKDHFLRGAIGEVLLHRDFSAIGKPLHGRVSAVFAWPTDPAQVAALRPSAKVDLAMLAVGECVTKAAPDKVFALLDTRIRSPAEQAATHELLPALQACIPSGETLSLNYATVRAYLGEAAYRVSVQQSGLQPG